MIPLRLELEAFMPFRQKQVLDFSHIMDDRIFLLCGNTGSGKTSIFDAISFALFGKASGSSRDTSNLKSHFADDSIRSYVDFTFLAGGVRYQVRRTPTQKRLRRNGNITPEATTAVLTLEDGTIFSSVREVDRKIEEILGIHLSQFKKIMMLPQGEFQRFLSDSSLDKQKILQHIFDTDIYRQMEDSLRQRYQALEEEIKQLTARLSVCKAELDFGSDETFHALLESEYSDYQRIIETAEAIQIQQHKQLKQLFDQLEQHQHRFAQLDLEAATAQNQKLQALMQAQQQYTELMSHQGNIDSTRKIISKLRDASEIAGMNKHLVHQQSLLQQVEQHLIRLKTACEDVQQQLTAAQPALEQEQIIQSDLPALFENIAALENRLALFEKRRDLVQQLDHTQQKHRLLKQHYRCFCVTSSLRQAKQILHALADASAALSTAQQADANFSNRETAYRHAFEQFLCSQAYALSKQLSEDTPCPVCGSISHPAPAQSTTEIISQETLDQCQRAYEQSAATLRKAQVRLASKWHELSTQHVLETDERSSKRANAYEHKQPIIAKLQAEWSCTQRDLSKQLDQLTATLEASEQKTFAVFDESTFLSQIEQCNATHKLLSKQIESLSTSIGDTDQQETLTQQCLAQKEYIQHHNQRFAQLSKRVSDLRSKLAGISASIQQNNLQKQELAQQIERACNEINQKLLSCGLSEAECAKLQDKIPHISHLEQQVSDWEKQCQHQKGLLFAYEDSAKGLTMIDISQMRIHKDQLGKQIAALQQQAAALQKNDTLAHQTLQNLKQSYADYCEKTTPHDEIKLLYDVTCGARGSRISFERYVLGVYFDTVIQSANLRLSEMTARRYLLRRRLDPERGNASSGLELEIFDAYSGRFRHVNTLSGGESFQAALSLALGFADVISQQSGGIELSTLFIDEGFGSLDEESLDLAIQSLMHLKDRGKYIGIISHVRELQEKIPRKLYLKQTKQGSECSFLPS